MGNRDLKNCRLDAAAQLREEDRAANGVCEQTQGYPQPKQAIDPREAAAITLKEAHEHEEIKGFQKAQLRMIAPVWIAQVHQMGQGMYQWFRHMGFWPKYWNPTRSLYRQGDHDQITISMDEYIMLKKCEKIALIHSEISEMLEGVRNNIPHGEKGCEGEELADTLVRMLDYAGGFEIDLGRHFIEKMEKNYERPFRHGKKF